MNHLPDNTEKFLTSFMWNLWKSFIVLSSFACIPQTTKRNCLFTDLILWFQWIVSLLSFFKQTDHSSYSFCWRFHRIRGGNVKLETRNEINWTTSHWSERMDTKSERNNLLKSLLKWNWTHWKMEKKNNQEKKVLSGKLFFECYFLVKHHHF